MIHYSLHQQRFSGVLNNSSKERIWKKEIELVINTRCDIISASSKEISVKKDI